MTIWSILSAFFRLLGFVKWAETLWTMHEITVKARSEANAPVTDDEEAEDLLK